MFNNKKNELLNDFDNTYNNYIAELKNVNDIEVRQSKLKKIIDSFSLFFDNSYSLYSDNYLSNSLLKEEIDYAMKGGGKRLRPLIMYFMYHIFNNKSSISLLDFMISIELIHSFSLIHDDMPCMDNDDIRRGKLSTWKKYGEDRALLAGDAMIFLASRIIVDDFTSETSNFDNIYKSYKQLLSSSGDLGMIAGQVYELNLQTKNNLLIQDILDMYSLKTSELFIASAVIGYRLADNKDEKTLNNVLDFAKNLGLAFQIKDDLLDIGEGNIDIGKPLYSDIKNEKRTYLAIQGIEQTKNDLNMYIKTIKDGINNIACTGKYTGQFIDLIDLMLK